MAVMVGEYVALLEAEFAILLEEAVLQEALELKGSFKGAGKGTTRAGLYEEEPEVAAAVTEFKLNVVTLAHDSLAGVASKQVQSAGMVSILGLMLIKSLMKPAG